jgi:hypothetical protein
MPSSSDQTRVGQTLTLEEGAESPLEGRDIELSVSPKDIRISPYDLCANRSDRRQSREGTNGSNPLPSSKGISNELYENSTRSQPSGRHVLDVRGSGCYGRDPDPILFSMG